MVYDIAEHDEIKLRRVSGRNCLNRVLEKNDSVPRPIVESSKAWADIDRGDVRSGIGRHKALGHSPFTATDFENV
jgi:hypothetical protein